MDFVLKRILPALLLGLSVSAQASTWVHVKFGTNRIYVPVPSLESVQTDTFHYGTTASLNFNGVGASTAVYYKVQQWAGDNATGGYGIANWSCLDRDTLLQGHTITLSNMASGRYQVTAAADMKSVTCDVAAFEAGQLLSSDITAPSEFLVINHDKFDHTDPAQAFLNQPDVTKYDLDVKWTGISGAQSYQLNINRDGVDYPITVDADSYNATNQYTVLDVHDSVNDTFTPYTGFGTYTFSLQYQLNGELSTPIGYTANEKILPIKPLFLMGSANNTDSSLPLDIVELVWFADSRTTHFKIREQNVENNAHIILPETFPTTTTLVEERTIGRYRLYNHWLQKTEDIVYRNRYAVYACVDRDCVDTDRSHPRYQDPGPSLRPVAQGFSQAEATALLDSALINPGEHLYVAEDSTDGTTPPTLTAQVWSNAIGDVGDGSEPRAQVMSEEILNRLEVKHEITAETTGLLGEQIDLSSGSVSFTHTDVSLPGNAGLPVSITRTHKGGNYAFQNTLEFADWQLAVPSIQTTMIKGNNYSGGWGRGNACSEPQRPEESVRVRTDDYEAFEYYNGTTLSVPGVTSEKLLNANFANPGIVDPAAYRYTTKDNWRISCLATHETFSGAEGFKATSPQGVTYYFDRYRLVQGDPLIKSKHVPRFYAFMLVSRVEDRFGNTVTYHYNSDNLLTSIVGQDVGEATPRTITINYKTETDQPYRIDSVEANGRRWTYGYTSDSKIMSTLTSVTRPDNTAWQYDLAEFSKVKVNKTIGSLCFASDTNCHVTGSITHPGGATGTFVWKQARHGRSQVPRMVGETSDTNLIPTDFATVSLAKKTLTGPGLDEMIWLYSYSKNVGSLAGETQGELPGTLPSHINALDHKTTTMTAPDGSKTIHYFNRSFVSLTDGKEVMTEYYDTNGSTLLKRLENTYAQGAKNGAVELSNENLNPIHYRANLTQTVQRLFNGASQSLGVYTTQHSSFTPYGKPGWTYGTNNVNNLRQYTRSSFTADTDNWLLDLPTRTEVSSDNSNWTTVSEKTYYSSGGIYKSLPHEEKSFGSWVKRNREYSSGNLTRVEFNQTMSDGNYRWQRFGNYKRGKATTITLPGRDTASSTLSATLAVDNNGWVTSVTNFNGEQTRYSYDAMGRVTKITPADTMWYASNFTFGKVSSGEASANVDVVSDMYKREMTKGNFKSTTYFDAMFRPLLVKTTDTTANVSRYQRKKWNIYGKESFTAYPSTNSGETQGMEHSFDGLQRPVKTEQTATGAAQTTVYLTGHKTRVTDYIGNVTDTTYLSYGEPKTEQMTRIDSRGKNDQSIVVTTQSYNKFGGVEEITQDGVHQKYFYNSRQQLCKIVRPDTGVTAYNKNTIGEITWIATGASGSENSCDAAGVLASEKTQYTYDNLGANKTVNYPDNSADIRYSYDPQGNMTELVAGDVTQSYEYHSGGVLKSENLSVDSKDLKISYGYNKSQTLTSLTYPDLTKVDFAPNGFGEPTKAAGYATNAQYFPDGQVKSFTYGNGVAHLTTLNSSKMPSSIKATKGSTTVMKYAYTYDNQGNLTNQTDNVDSKYSITGMTYDGLERLTAATGYWGDVSIGYDQLGNITNYDFDNSAQVNSTLPSSTLAYTYNADNQLESVRNGTTTQTFSYDSRGNVTDNGKQTFAFNKAQQITSSDAATYVYDGHGRRVIRDSAMLGKSYSLYSQSGDLLYREQNGQGINYIFMGGKQVARIDAAIEYIHTDLLGSPVVETNSSGTEIAGTRLHYRPFGATIETPKDEVGYTGHKFDTDTGLSYMQQRYYDPAIGRFYSNDPVGFKNVHNFNRYTYAANNPYKYVDPDGRDVIALFPEQKNRIQNMMSKKAVGAYAFDSKGRLVKRKFGSTRGGSAIYSAALDFAIASDKTMVVAISSTYGGQSVDLSSGGGLTDPFGEGNVGIVISGNKGRDGSDPSLVLMHEIGTHGVNLMKQNQKPENAIEMENEMREQTGDTARPANKNHVSHKRCSGSRYGC